MECWWADPSSHDGSVHVHSRARSVSGKQLMAGGWDFADLQNDSKEQSHLLECSYCAGPFLYT